MKPKTEKIILLIFIFTVGFMNLGMTVGLSLLLDDQATVKSQLLEFVIIIYVVLLVNFLVLSVYSNE